MKVALICSIGDRCNRRPMLVKENEEKPIKQKPKMCDEGASKYSSLNPFQVLEV